MLKQSILYTWALYMARFLSVRARQPLRHSAEGKENVWTHPEHLNAAELPEEFAQRIQGKRAVPPPKFCKMRAAHLLLID
jgi:hypothetical protein